MTSQPGEAKRTDSVMTERLDVPTKVLSPIDAVLCISYSGCDLALARGSLASVSALSSPFLINAGCKAA